MFEQFPYTNLHELNLDWIIAEVKKAYSPDNPPENMVLSVNGLTGDVILYEGAVVQLPTVADNGWNLFRKIGETQIDSGIEFRPDGKARLINGTSRHEIYSENNPPYKEQNVELPAIDSPSWNVYRFAEGTTVGIKLEKGSAIYRINGTDRIKVYDEQNQPPYPVQSVNGMTGVVNLTFPVTSVNGQTGAVRVQVPFANTAEEILEVIPVTAENNWGFTRRTSGGYAGIKLDTDGGTINAYLTLNPIGAGSPQTIKLLTSADIPEDSGVISVNGQTGVVTLTFPVTSVNGKTGAITLTGADVKTGNDNKTIAATLTELKAGTDDATTLCNNKLITPSMAIPIPTVNAGAVRYNMEGLTADYIVAEWTFTNSPDNIPPADITIITYPGYFTIQNTYGVTDDSVKPVFILATVKTTTVET